MDLSTMLIDLLRGDEENQLLNRGGKIAMPPAKPPGNAGTVELSLPGYAAYKREALISGEPVMSPEEFKEARAEGKL